MSSAEVGKIDRRKLLVGGLLAASSAAVWARQPSERIDYLGNRKLDDLIPKQIGGWKFATTSGLVVPPEDALSDSLYSQLMTRVYDNGRDPPVMLLIAQSAGQTGLLQVHRPEFCYPAGGFQLSPIVQRPIPVAGRARLINQLTASAPGRTEQILYWTRVGDGMPISWRQQRLAVAIDNLKGKIPDAVLVRVSSVDLDWNSTFTRLGAFVEQLLSQLPVSGRKVLVA